MNLLSVLLTLQVATGSLPSDAVLGATTNAAAPNSAPTSDWVKTCENYFDSSQYWSNKYWTDSWSNFSSWMWAQYNQEYNYQHNLTVAQDAYFASEFDKLNQMKVNQTLDQSLVDKFFAELRCRLYGDCGSGGYYPVPRPGDINDVPAPIGYGWCILAPVLLYGYGIYRRHRKKEAAAKAG